MTTIAIDINKDIAADGLLIWGDEILSYSEKKLRTYKEHVYALVGPRALFDPLIEWHYEYNADPSKVPVLGKDDHWTLVVIDPSNRVGKYSSSCPYVEYFEPPVAFGAGLDIALGAMLAGASSIEAIALVSTRNIYTGGIIQTSSRQSRLSGGVK